MISCVALWPTLGKLGKYFNVNVNMWKWHVKVVAMIYALHCCKNHISDRLGNECETFNRDAKSDRYGRYICAILSKMVLIFGPCTDRNRNRERCAVRPVLLTLWSQHSSDSRVLLTIYQHDNPIIQLNLMINIYI